MYNNINRNNLTFWQKISPWFERKYYFFTTFSFIVAIVTLIEFFLKDDVKSEKDLIILTGQVSNYSFKDISKGNRMLHEYYIWINNYSNTFQIKADYIKYFRTIDFENKVLSSKTIQFTIPKYQIKELNIKEKNIYIMSIDVGYNNYLDKNKTIDIEKSIIDIFVSIGFIIVGLLWYFLRKYKLKRIPGVDV